jgi:hypothetical protein
VDIAAAIQQWPIHAVVALIAGVIVLLAPRVLNYVVAAYLLVVGALGLLQFFGGHPIRPEPVIAVVAGLLVLIKPNILSYVVGIYLILIGLLDAGILRLLR